MSSSDPTPRKHTGRVFLGVDTPGPDRMSIQELEGKKRLTWDETMDEEFITRVRTKAQGMARDIIAKAMQEAESIREQARQEGMQLGMSQGEQLLQEQLDNTAAGLGQVLETIRAQSENVWQARKADILQLIHVAVQATLGVEIEQRRAEILELLLHQSLERLESDRFLTLRCAPEDADLLDELLQVARQTNPKLLKWMVRPDGSITSGVIVEAENAKVENDVDGRWDGVRTILDQLALRGPAKEG